MRKIYIPIPIVKKEKRKEKSFFLLWENIHKYLGSIILTFTIWSILFFLVPYFMYYKFLPMDTYLINSNLIFVLAVIISIILLLLVFPAFFLYLSLTSYLEIRNRISEKDLILSIIIGTFLIDFISIIGFLKEEENIKTYLWLIVVSVILGFIYYFALRTSIHIIGTRQIYEPQKSKKEIFVMLIISYFAFISFLIICPTIITFMFLIEYIENILVYIVMLIIFIFIYYVVVIFFIDTKDKLSFLLVLIFIIPLIFTTIFSKEYVKRLFIFYSHFGLASDKNIVLIKKDIYNTLPENISHKLLMCKSQNFKNEDKDKDYVCLEDIKIIWNGNKKIFISVEDKLTLPIDKSALFNGDFIRKRKHKLSEKKKNNTSY